MTELHRIAVRVNGRDEELEVEARRTLAEVLREDLGLTGTHLGCEHGVCGACTVRVDGRAARSCLMLAVQADGTDVETVESLGEERPRAHPAGDGERHAFQCAFCAPGFLMTVRCLLDDNPTPTTGRDPEGAVGQPLSLHGIPQHRRRRRGRDVDRSPGRCDDA